jgi:lipoyl(octanoyl) transferase
MSPASGSGGQTLFRLIVHPRMEGRLDMAIDEALAEAVGAGESHPVIRLYGFSPATLSLGRFQKIKGRFAREKLDADGITLVRRPTGGHAVLHDNELTYSVALSKQETGPILGGEGKSTEYRGSRKREVYEFIARILLQGLAELGIQGKINSSQRGDIHNPDCFGSSGEYEITGTDGRKLIGSAQMTTRHAILQHGSIPLENPGRRVFRYITVEQAIDAHEPSSLNEEAGTTLSFGQVQAAFAAAVRKCLRVEDSDLLPAEKEAADRILAEKYANDAWNLSS